MIIKSMSRKTRSFTQLYDYLTREQDSLRFSRNIYCNVYEKEDLLKEFYKNAEYLNNSRGRVFLYHEIISLRKNNLSQDHQQRILYDLANKYLEKRANNHLSFGIVHRDKDNVHLHLMISSNELEGSRRKRLSKKEFGSIQREIENYKNSRYKELEKSSLYQQGKDFTRSRNKEQEMKRRGGRSVRDKVREELEGILKRSQSKTHFENMLKERGFEFYKRKTVVGVIYNEKKYRLSTLKLDDLYEKQLAELDRREERKTRREEQKQERSRSRSKDSKEQEKER